MTVIDRRYSVAEGTAMKAPCRAATTANITLSGEQTVDGVAVVDGDRVLVKSQSTASENGIYQASTGNWSRARDFDGAYDVVTGTRVWVTSGGANARTEWEVTTTGTITIGTTSIAFSVTSSLVGAFADGSEAAPGAAFVNYPSWGFYKTASGIGVSIAGTKVFEFLSSLFVQTAHIAANAVTLAKLVAASAQGRVLARKSSGSGDWEEATVSEIIDLLGTPADGDILYRTGGVWALLPKGTDGQIIRQASGLPSWFTPIFVAEYTSADISLSAAATGTLTHNLGGIPKFVQLFLVCQTGEANYSPGDVVAYGNTGVVGAGSTGMSIVVTSTSIIYRQNSNPPYLPDKTTGSSANLTLANWKLRIKAFA